VRVRRVVIGLIAGLILGSVLAATSPVAASRTAAVLQPIGQLWVNAIRMTVVPLVVALLFVAIAGRSSAESNGDVGDAPDTERELGRVGLATIVTFFALLLFAALVGVLLAPSLIDDLHLTGDMAASLRSTAVAGAGQTAAHVTALPGFGAWVTGLLPVNAIASAAEGAMLPLIAFTLLFALATRRVDAGPRRALIDFFGAIAGAMTAVVDWIIAAAPIGIFALVTVASSRAGIGLAGAMLYYVVSISALVVLFTLLMYPVASIFGRVPLGRYTRDIAPAQAVALGTSSSLASLPALVEGGRALRLSATATGFVLPLSVSTFKVATPIYWLVGTLFLAKLYGVALGTTAVVTIALTGAALSFTIPGVPQGAMLMLAPLLVTYGIPADGVGLLIAVDSIPDLFGTLTNVTGDLVVATIVSAVTRRDLVAEPVTDAASSTDE
jgi:proton glutamate symport protein